jgi:Protein of unknown function (DUF3995)
LVFAAVLLLLAAVHVYWALGGDWGSSATVPTMEGRRTINPSRLATYAVALLLVVGAVIICGQVQLFATGRFSALFRLGSWFLCGVFLLRTMGNLKTFGIFKTVYGTVFADWDTRLYSPLCFALAVLAGVCPRGMIKNCKAAQEHRLNCFEVK